MCVFFRKDGAITIFLSIILVAVLIITFAFVEAARIKTAETQIQSAVDLASKSTLASYNSVLKDVFGLMALSNNDPEMLKDEFIYYLEKTLNTAGESDDGYKPFDIYDFKLEDIEMQLIYNLSEPNVLRSQILEYMKYRAPKELAEGILDKILSFKHFKKQADVMKEKLDVDDKLEKLRETQESASDNVLMVNSLGKMANEQTQEEKDIRVVLNEAVKVVVEKITYEKQVKDIENEIKLLNDKKDELNKKIDELEKATQKKKDDAEKSSDSSSDKDKKKKKKTVDTSAEEKQIAELKKQIADIESKITAKENELAIAKDNYDKKSKELSSLKEFIDSHIEAAKNAAEDAINDFDDILDKSPKITKQIDDINGEIKNDTNDFADTTRTDLGGKKVKIDSAKITPIQAEVTRSLADINNVADILNQNPMDGVNLDSFGGVVPSKAQASSKLGVDRIATILNGYNGYINKDKGIDYIIVKEPLKEKTEKQTDPSDFAKKKLADSKNKKDTNASFNIPQDGLPSRDGMVPTGIPEIDTDKAYVQEMFKKMKLSEIPKTAYSVNGDTEPDEATDSGIESSKEMMDGLDGLIEVLTNGLLTIRNELYIDEYILNTFKNHTTTADELDLRGRPLGDRKSAFGDDKTEIEYIIAGKSNTGDNFSSVKNRILLIRFILNTISIYTDPYKFNIAMEAAWTVAGWTGGIGVPLAHTIIMLAWALAESVVDVEQLTKGKAIPIFKTKNTWILSPGAGGLAVLKDETTERLTDTANATIDYVTGSAKDNLDKIKLKLRQSIEQKVDQSIDKTFNVVEVPLRQMMNSVDTLYNNTSQAIDDYEEGDISTALKDIDKQVSDSLKLEFDAVSRDAGVIFSTGYEGMEITASMDKFSKSMIQMEKEYNLSIAGKTSKVVKTLKEKFNKDKNDIYTRITTAIKEKKKTIRLEILSKIKGLVDNLNSKVDEQINRFSEAGKEKVGEILDSAGGRSTSKSSKTNLKTSLLSMTYKDYLRLLLLITGSEAKVKRTADIIQMEMCKITDNECFRLSDCNTYLRVESKVSMKYLFMMQPFIPKQFRTPDGKRHQFDVTLYKGY